MERETLREWMAAVMAEKKWNARQWALAANTSPSNITRFMKKIDAPMPTTRTLAKLAAAAGSNPPGFLDANQNLTTSAQQSSSAPAIVTNKGHGDTELGLFPLVSRQIVEGASTLPIYASAEGGDGEMVISFEPIEYAKRPEPLENVPDAFGFYCVGSSMSPRYEQGDLILVHPKKPVTRGDDVLVILVSENTNDHAAMIKKFERQTDSAYFLKQLNPPKTIEISRKKVHSVHLIVGRYNRSR